MRPWTKEEYRNEGIRQGDDKGNFKRVEILNKKESDEDSTGEGPDAFKDINPSDGGDVFPDVLGIEGTPVSEKSTLGECHREEDQKGGIEDWPQAKSFSRSEKKDASECSGEIDGEWKGYGKKQLEEHEDF
jgi:hypothetical protein